MSGFDSLNRSGLEMVANGTPQARVPMFDALDRPLPDDWLKGCAQAREARLILERRA